MCIHRLSIALAVLGFFCLRTTLAASTCDAPSDTCAIVGRWNLSVALGYGLRSNPIITGRDIPLVVIPKVSYYGKRFFLENLDIGFTLYENDVTGFNVIATPGYDSVFFYRYDPQNFFVNISADVVNTLAGPVSSQAPPNSNNQSPQSTSNSDAALILERSRKITYLLGPEWHFDFHSLTGQLDMLYEATGRYNGSEIRAALALPLLRSHGTLMATAGGTWKSAALVTYYYGEPGIYDASSAFNPFVKLSYTLSITGHWGIQALAHYEWLGDSIVKSPIVVAGHVTTFFAGVTYSF